MNSMECEAVRQAAMARADGEIVSLNAGQIESHLADCPECRRAVETLRPLLSALDAQSRRPQTVDLWPRIRGRLPRGGPVSGPAHRAGMLALLVAALVIARGMLLVAAEPAEWGIRAAALLLVGGWFLLLRENPFTIRSNLIRSEETQP